jgi:hypothetical protein
MTTTVQKQVLIKGPRCSLLIHTGRGVSLLATQRVTPSTSAIPPLRPGALWAHRQRGGAKSHPDLVLPKPHGPKRCAGPIGKILSMALMF